MLPTTIFLSAFLFSSTAFAAPAAYFGRGIFDDNTDNNTVLPVSISSAAIDKQFLKPALLSRVVYCGTDVAHTLTCGPACDQLKAQMPQLKMVLNGGDAADIPRFFVAHDPSSSTVIVAHEGTNTSQILSLANDLQLGLVPLNTTLFPGVKKDQVQIHDGFQKTFHRTSELILTTVQNTLRDTKSSNVLVVGHSLGAAIASIDAVMLRMQLPKSIQLTSAVFGLPRVGDQGWASLIDTSLGSHFAFVTNQQDPVPIVPGRFLGFRHPAGEVHINAVNNQTGNLVTAVKCAGGDNTHCSEGNSLVDENFENHRGPYFHNITIPRCSQLADPSSS